MNNINYTAEQLFELYDQLPEDLQGVVRDENLGPAIQVIGKDSGMTPVQALGVEDVVIHTLLGIKTLRSFSRRVKERLNISENIAQKITKDIYENIFSQVKESLEKIQPPKEDVGGVKKLDLSTNTNSSTDIEKSNLPDAVPKKIPTPIIKIPIPASSSSVEEPIPPTAPDILPNTTTVSTQSTEDAFALPNQPKPIVGAEKIGVGLPDSNEHIFEKKLREVTQAPAPVKTQEEVVVTPKQTPFQERKIDPYREPMNEDLEK